MFLFLFSFVKSLQHLWVRKTLVRRRKLCNYISGAWFPCYFYAKFRGFPTKTNIKGRQTVLFINYLVRLRLFVRNILIWKILKRNLNRYSVAIKVFHHLDQGNSSLILLNFDYSLIKVQISLYFLQNDR